MLVRWYVWKVYVVVELTFPAASKSNPHSKTLNLTPKIPKTFNPQAHTNFRLCAAEPYSVCGLRILSGVCVADTPWAVPYILDHLYMLNVPDVDVRIYSNHESIANIAPNMGS